VALGIWGFFLFPELLQPSPWLESIFVVLFGYGIYRVLSPRIEVLPRITFDWALLFALISAFALALGLLFGSQLF